MNQTVITNLLQNLVGSGFTASITVNGFNFTGQKVVSFENGVVYTVNNAGLVRATPISSIISVDF